MPGPRDRSPAGLWTLPDFCAICPLRSQSLVPWSGPAYSGPDEVWCACRISTAHPIPQHAPQIPRPYGAHTLRKTFGYIQRTVYGVGFELLCERYNHSSPAITMRYLGIESKEVKGILMNEIGWLKSLKCKFCLGFILNSRCPNWDIPQTSTPFL